MILRIMSVAMILAATGILLKRSNEKNKWVKSSKILAVVAILLAVISLIVSFF